MYKFWYHNVKGKSGENRNFLYGYMQLHYSRENRWYLILREMLKQYLTLQVLNYTDHYRKEKTTA